MLHPAKCHCTRAVCYFRLSVFATYMYGRLSYTSHFSLHFMHRIVYQLSLLLTCTSKSLPNFTKQQMINVKANVKENTARLWNLVRRERRRLHTTTTTTTTTTITTTKQKKRPTARPTETHSRQLLSVSRVNYRIIHVSDIFQCNVRQTVSTFRMNYNQVN